ncbi:MAG: hypothetical protein GX653_07330 [Clostridiales bacterium]|nr:hypothetical protein [Clostridiales bacterium]
MPFGAVSLIFYCHRQIRSYYTELNRIAFLPVDAVLDFLYHGVAPKFSFECGEKLKTGGGFMDRSNTSIEQLFAHEGPIIRSKRLKLHGYDSRAIQSMLSTNTLIRLKDGYYTMQDILPDLTDAQIAVSTIPDAVLYFLSAASFHGLITAIPTTVHVAVPNKGVMPTKPKFPPVDITRLIPRIHGLGKIVEPTEPLPIACYDRERTICDLARRWEEIGKDLLIEAIRTYLQGSRNLQQLYAYAQDLRVREVIHPYLEAMA